MAPAVVEVPPAVVAHAPILNWSELDAMWSAMTASGLLPASTEPTTIWISKRCRGDLAERVRQSLARFLCARHIEPRWFDARRCIGHASLQTPMVVESPLFPRGTHLPSIWLEHARHLLVCELDRDALWRFRGAMDAQAEPLDSVFPQPWFRRPVVLCEAQRLAGADLVLVLCHTEGQEVCLAAPSALMADVMLACAAGLWPTAVPHLAEWRRHFLEPQCPAWPASAAPRLDTRDPLLAHSAWSPSVVRAMASTLQGVAQLGDDAVRAWHNLHRIPGFLGKRIRSAPRSS